MRSDRVIETDQGEWRDGRQTGHGVQVWPAGQYEGTLADGLPNGRGVLRLGGFEYQGEFLDGKPNGPGTLRQGAKTVQGTWKDGCLIGGEHKMSVGVPLSACR
jgi:hypothetical protein